MASFITLFLVAISGILMAAPANAEGCKRMTAALELGDQRFIFFGNTYIALDSSFNEIGKGDETYNYFGGPHPEAAFIFALDNTRYIFSDKYYFSPWANNAPVDAEQFGGQRYGYFFKDGLDAAGNLRGTTFLFKGCEFIFASMPYGPSSPARVPDGIPCNLDAALTVGDELWLFKDDKMWNMPVYGLKPDPPVDTRAVIHFKDIKLCAEGES